MNFQSVGDLAAIFQNRHQVQKVKSDLARLSQELASGQRADPAASSGGDFSPLVGLENGLRTNSAYAVSISEAELFASTMQSSLEFIQSNASEAGPALLIASNAGHPAIIRTATADAASKFSAVVSAFNAKSANRHVFSGTATDQPALVPAETILTALQAAVSSDTTASQVEATVDAWFNSPGGGYETSAYLGSTNTLAPFSLSENDSAGITVTALDPEARQALKAFALAALVGRGVLNGNVAEQAALTRKAGEEILSAESSLVTLRAGIGTAQERIEQVRARNSAERTALEMARTDLVSIDPYRAATELEAAQAQLETLYSLTVRLSRLSLADFMR